MKILNTLNKDYIIDITATYLILISLFLNFFVDINYPLFSKELIILSVTLIFFSAVYVYFIPPDLHLVKCGIYSILITIFMDFQFEFLKWWAERVFVVLILTFVALWLVRKHVSVILLTVFATINITTVIVPLGPVVEKLLVAEEDKGRPEADLPILVHLILDEHIGLEGIPTDIPGGKETRDTLLAFFQEYGFHIFGGAYSRYFNSDASMSSLLNFASSLPPERLYYMGESNSTLSYNAPKSNLYFQKMRSAGYRIRVYQSTYMDYCREALIGAGDCFSYNYRGIKSSALTSLNTFQRWELITGVYLNSYSRTSWFMRQFRRFYKHVSKSFSIAEKTTFAWSEWDGRISPISTMPAIDKLIADVELGTKGSLYFAHLLLPHYPYIYDRTCQIRTPIFDWKNRISPTASSAETRAIRYPFYFEQIHCMLFRLQDLFERMKAANIFRDATIIVHGDHGSRIVVTDVNAENEDRLTAEDLVDGFSTLFAVKAPSQTTGYDREMRPIEEIFQQVIHGSTDAPSSPEEHYVYLRKEGGGWSQIRLPTIPWGVE